MRLFLFFLLSVVIVVGFVQWILIDFLLIMNWEDYDLFLSFVVLEYFIDYVKMFFIDVYSYYWWMVIQDFDLLICQMDSFNMGIVVNLSGCGG